MNVGFSSVLDKPNLNNFSLIFLSVKNRLEGDKSIFI